MPSHPPLLGRSFVTSERDARLENYCGTADLSAVPTPFAFACFLQIGSIIQVSGTPKAETRGGHKTNKGGSSRTRM
eukprot:gene22932-biopygen20784